MIIWGSKAKQKQIGNGTFYCPRCRKQSAYTHIRVSRYFTLYFIPLFPTGTLGEAVRCVSCSGEYNTRVLSLSVAEIEAALQPWPCPKCGNRNPQAEVKCLSCGATKGALPPAIPQQPAQLADNDDRYKPKG